MGLEDLGEALGDFCSAGFFPAIWIFGTTTSEAFRACTVAHLGEFEPAGLVLSLALPCLSASSAVPGARRNGVFAVLPDIYKDFSLILFVRLEPWGVPVLQEEVVLAVDLAETAEDH